MRKNTFESKRFKTYSIRNLSLKTKNVSDNLKDLKHPMQPIGWDETEKVIRFKKNKIVRFLLNEGPFDLNQLSRMNSDGMFDEGDYTHLMQLIGYSVSGYGELSTSPEDIVKRADIIASQISKRRRLK